tara:strand:+ start:6427 stop:7584 length:1158 start_codon:yes stop_codon:yes gene_type:complete
MKYVFTVLSPFWFIVSLFFIKNKKIWLYGAWFGERYADNSKVFFEYSNSLNDDIQHYWIYKNKELKEIIIEKGYKCAYAYSLKGIILQLKAKVFITCVNSSDFIPFLLTPRNYFVQLYHGSPIKHIGVDSRKNKIRRILDIIRLKTIDDYSLIVSPSDVFDSVFKRAFFKGQDRIFRSGYPRNKNLVINEETRIKIRSYFNVHQEEKLVAYLPTHRNEGKSENPFIPILKELILKDQFLKQNKIKVIVKPHFYEKDSLKDIKDTNNVLIKYDFPFDLYEFLGATDVLVTDYSSVMFDYELLNKRIMVYPFDLEKYTASDRNLYFDFRFLYENVLNVKKVESVDHLCKSLANNTKEQNKEKSIFNEPFGSYSENIYIKLIKELEIK